jgi:hypothetical protein
MRLFKLNIAARNESLNFPCWLIPVFCQCVRITKIGGVFRWYASWRLCTEICFRLTRVVQIDLRLWPSNIIFELAGRDGEAMSVFRPGDS